jgi:hypothetical protein
MLLLQRQKRPDLRILQTDLRLPYDGRIPDGSQTATYNCKTAALQEYLDSSLCFAYYWHPGRSILYTPFAIHKTCGHR